MAANITLNWKLLRYSLMKIKNIEHLLMSILEAWLLLPPTILRPIAPHVKMRIGRNMYGGEDDYSSLFLCLSTCVYFYV